MHSKCRRGPLNPERQDPYPCQISGICRFPSSCHCADSIKIYVSFTWNNEISIQVKVHKCCLEATVASSFGCFPSLSNCSTFALDVFYPSSTSEAPFLAGNYTQTKRAVATVVVSRHPRKVSSRDPESSAGSQSSKYERSLLQPETK